MQGLFLLHLLLEVFQRVSLGLGIDHFDNEKLDQHHRREEGKRQALRVPCRNRKEQRHLGISDSLAAMAKLSRDESDVLERVLSLRSGYVLDFTNRTFSDFVLDVVGADPYSGEYEKFGTSKAKILRGIIESENDTTVSKLILALLNREKRFPNLDAYPIVTDSDRNSAQGIALRLAGQLHTELPTLTLAYAHDVFRRVREEVENCINSKAYEAGLDRLHTFLTMYLRLLVVDDAGNTQPHDVPLHSLMGLYIKGLQTNGRQVSEMTLRILRSSISTLESFNTIRNNHSLAHPTDQLIQREEAEFIFTHIVALVCLIERLNKSHN